MLRLIYKEGDEITGSTVGCGCCSSEVYTEEEIKEELRGNLRILQEAADIFGVSLQELLCELSF